MELDILLEKNDLELYSQELPPFIKKYEKLSKRMDRILRQGDRQQLEVIKLTEELEDKNTKIKNLLNNAGQGFLYFDKNMIIGKEYSKKAVRILGIEISGQDITKLLYKDDESKQLFLKSTLRGILDEPEIRQEILISLLQNEFERDNKFIEIEYKILDKESFMMILTDITSKKELTIKIKEEQQVLKMVVEVVTSLEQFVEIKTNYINLILFINNYKSLDKLNELRREIHTFKGLFAQKEMLNIVKELHNFETEIDISIKQNKLTDIIKNITFNIMNSWIEKDISTLKDILGKDFFNKSNYILIDRNRLGKLQAKIKLYIDKKRIKGDAVSTVLKDIEELKYNSVKTLFRPYEKLVEQLSLKLNKEVYPLQLNGDNIYIGNIYKSFINSLVHIFRNSLDHGIETPEVRYELGKDLKGTIKCTITENIENISICIEDDGAGINPINIKNIAMKKGILTDKQFSCMSDKDIIFLIFQDDFSTAKVVTNISGRGVGLSSVLNELHKLGGNMDIENNIGYGIKFTFTLPIENSSNNENDLLEKLSLKTISYYEENLNIKLDTKFIIEEVDLIKVDKKSILIPLTNDMDGIVYMGISNTHAIELISQYLDDSMTEDEIEEIAISNLAETLNITLGNILKDLNIMKNGGIVGIEVPIINDNKNITKDENSKIIVSKLKYKDEEIQLGYFI
ncbi:MAG: chemotaxis protein CheX [Arcobacteraceae bacterium]|nr:chemotaxis protein CheX [Arcobacteraceae bacterium]